jgi:hypothetical protein
MSEITKENCLFCGSAENITREHIISKSLFPDGYAKNNLLTLPSCQTCNSSYSHEEELFRLFLVNQSTDVSQAARDMLHGKITRAMKKSPGKAANVLKKMFSTKIKNEDGGFEDKAAFHISEDDWKGHHRVLDKYVKGLYFHHTGKSIPTGQVIIHTFVSDASKIPADVKSSLVWKVNHQPVYAYAYAIVPDTLQSTWTFVFYDKVIFQTFTTFPGDLESHIKE